MFFRQRINVRQQAVALFNELPSNGFLLGSAYPGFLGVGSFLCVIAKDGIKRSNFNPFCKQVHGWGTAEAANIVPDDAKAAQSEIQEHEGAYAQMIIGARIIARPGGRVALTSRIGGAGQDKWPQVGV